MSAEIIPFPTRAPLVDEEPELMDLNKMLIRGETTFGLNAEGDAKASLGVRDGDLLICDRALKPRVGDLIIEEREGDLYVERFRRALSLADSADVAGPIFGVVTFVIHATREGGAA